ncbi:MAG: WD40 repeat domain-containing protein [Lachnospiraceae bacterium]|nr:WD40 repeat domain-containing protein [Lachnospiraceae bacterium]
MQKNQEKRILREYSGIGAILSEDGKRIYCSMGKQGVYILETDTGELHPVDIEGYQVSNSGEVQEAFAVNKDGSLLAVSCLDGMLRVLDLKNMETVNEIPFAGRNRRFIKFSEDDQTVFLQGDDYYFRIYDLKKQEFSYVSAGQYYKIEDFIVNEDFAAVSLVTTSDLVILNAEDYERIAQIGGGRAYLPKESKILCSYGRALYQFPYMTLEGLKEEAKRQFGDGRLTEQERIRYHVD